MSCGDFIQPWQTILNWERKKANYTFGPIQPTSWRTSPYEHEYTAAQVEYAKVEAQQGWQCPRCLTIYNPYVQKCECAKEPPKTTSNTVNIEGIDEWTEYKPE